MASELPDLPAEGSTAEGSTAEEAPTEDLYNDFGVRFYQNGRGAGDARPKPPRYDTDGSYEHGEINKSFADFVADKVRIGMPAAGILLHTLVWLVMPIMTFIAECTNDRVQQEHDMNNEITGLVTFAGVDILRFFMFNLAVALWRPVCVEGDDWIHHKMNQYKWLNRTKYYILSTKITYGRMHSTHPHFWDKFSKIEEKYNDLFAWLMKCTLKMVIDETLVAFRGRMKARQYMPRKPGKTGMLARTVAMCFCRFLLKAFFYFGAGDDRYPKRSVELDILSTINDLPKGTSLYFDNAYSMKSALDLCHEKMINFTGTVRRNRTFLPLRIRNSDQHCGLTAYTRATFESDYCFVEITKAKKSNKACIFVTNTCGTNDATTENLAIQPFNQSYLPSNTRSEVSRDYNGNMGSIDAVDQIIATLHRQKLKNKKWTTNLAYWFFCALLVNLSTLLQLLKVPDVPEMLKKKSRANFFAKMLEFYDKEYFKGTDQEQAEEGLDSVSQSLGRCKCFVKGCRNKSEKKCRDCLVIVCGAHAYVLCMNHGKMYTKRKYEAIFD